MGGAVIDTINNCGWIAGEQIIFSSADEVTDFICRYAPLLVYDYESKIHVTGVYDCFNTNNGYRFNSSLSSQSFIDSYIRF